MNKRWKPKRGQGGLYSGSGISFSLPHKPSVALRRTSALPRFAVRISAILALHAIWSTAALAEPQWFSCSQHGSVTTIRNSSAPDETDATRHLFFVIDREARTLRQYDAGTNRLSSWEEPLGEPGDIKVLSSSVIFAGTGMKATLKADFPPGRASPEDHHLVDTVDIDFTRGTVVERIAQTGTDGWTSRAQYEGTCRRTERPSIYQGEP